jgi:hypothetical protein
MGDLTRRRWWPLSDVLSTDRLKDMFAAAAAETESRFAVAQQLAATLSHVDSEGAIDWVGVVDPTLRVLPEDQYFGGRAGPRRRHPGRDRIMALPNEASLTTWVAHRSHRALEPLFDKLFEVCGGAMSVAANVACRQRRGGQRCHPGAAAGRVERTDQHASGTGRAGRVGGVRCAGSGIGQNPC